MNKQMQWTLINRHQVKQFGYRSGGEVAWGPGIGTAAALVD